MQTAAEYFRRSDLLHVEIGRREGQRATEIARRWDMKGADALHLATAELHGCTNFYSLDHDQLKVGTGIAGLSVTSPEPEAQVELTFEE